jgi:nucleoside-diphosphate-sugar epimerase
MMKTILVTGGAGFVGSHACKALSRAGYVPVTFDNLEHGHERAVKWGPLERGDLRNHDDLKRAFATHRPWAVMHFAAHAYVGESTLDPAKYYDNNVGGTAKLLQACAAFGCQNVVFSSSCATYGVPERLPLTEDDLMFIRLHGDGTNNTARQLALWRQALIPFSPVPALVVSLKRVRRLGPSAVMVIVARSRFNDPIEPMMLGKHA